MKSIRPKQNKVDVKKIRGDWCLFIDGLPYQSYDKKEQAEMKAHEFRRKLGIPEPPPPETNAKKSRLRNMLNALLI